MADETTRITIDLPTPAHIVSDRGFTHVEGRDLYERSHADRAVVSINGEDLTVREAEEWALSILWLVREHYQGEGLASEVDRAASSTDDLSRSLVEALGEDDGERWYAQGHVDSLAMAFSVLVVEMHLTSPDEAAQSLLSGTFAPGTIDTHHDWLAAAQTLVDSVGYLWAREDESRGEGMFPCEPDDDGAEPWTELRL